jgi:hypothetical protein
MFQAEYARGVTSLLTDVPLYIYNEPNYSDHWLKDDCAYRIDDKPSDCNKYPFLAGLVRLQSKNA